jgi:hypothetical protein
MHLRINYCFCECKFKSIQSFNQERILYYSKHSATFILNTKWAPHNPTTIQNLEARTTIRRRLVRLVITRSDRLRLQRTFIFPHVNSLRFGVTSSVFSPFRTPVKKSSNRPIVAKQRTSDAAYFG